MKPISFNGSGFEYFKIWIVNILLTIVTLSLYYPWAKVRNRRYFYANTSLDGRNFEYHATGKQLFVGYLISIAVLVAYVVMQNSSLLGSLAVLGIFFLCLPWLIWRSLKFNMSMTSFSNVRFRFDGDLKGAYLNYLVLPVTAFFAVYLVPALLIGGAVGWGGASNSFLLSFLILVGGLLTLTLSILSLSFLAKRNNHYQILGTAFGKTRFGINLKTMPFVKIYLKAIALSLGLIVFILLSIGIVSYLVVGLGAILDLQAGMQDVENIDPEKYVHLFSIVGSVYLFFIFAYTLVYAYLQTRFRAYIYNNVSLGQAVSFESTLKARSLFWVFASNFIMLVFTFGLAMPWIKVRLAKLMASNTLVDTSNGFDSYLNDELEYQSSLGEQIGDAFDVDVDVAL